MNTGLSLFDYAESQRLAEVGIAAAAENAGSAVLRLQEIAREYGRLHRTATADDIRRECIKQGLKPQSLGNAAGAMFRAVINRRPDWRKTGRYVKSTWMPSHGRMIAEWEFVGK